MATAAQSRSLASPAVREIVGRRLSEISGLAMAMAGIAVLVSLATYNPRDPSLNTATSQAATNLAGPAGAVVADFLLQGFGVAGALPGLVLLAWAWRIAVRRRLGRKLVRVLCMLLAMPCLACVVSLVNDEVTWPSSAGLGGAGGHLLAATFVEWTRVVLGPFGPACVFAAAAVLGAGFATASFGLSFGEWRAAGRGAG